jgi:hypothetical protein
MFNLMNECRFCSIENAVMSIFTLEIKKFSSTNGSADDATLHQQVFLPTNFTLCKSTLIFIIRSWYRQDNDSPQSLTEVTKNVADSIFLDFPTWRLFTTTETYSVSSTNMSLSQVFGLPVIILPPVFFIRLHGVISRRIICGCVAPDKFSNYLKENLLEEYDL